MAESTPQAVRQLIPILEEPDERKPKSDDEDSFSDDSVELPRFESAVPKAKIAFPESSFSNLMDRSSKSVLSSSPRSSVTGVGSLPAVGNPETTSITSVTIPKKMTPVLKKIQKVEDFSDDSEDTLDDKERSTNSIFTHIIDPWSESGEKNHDFFISSSGISQKESYRNLERNELLVSPTINTNLQRNSTTVFDEDNLSRRRLEQELVEARSEISKLVEAIHEKDHKVLDAQETIKKLADSSIGNKRDSGQLQQMLASALENANTLETKNVYLLTQIDSLAHENQVLMKNLHDIAQFFRVRDIPANDQALAYHLKARIENLLDKEKELTSIKSNPTVDQFEIERLQKETENSEKAFVAVKERLEQTDAIHKKIVTNLNNEISRLEDALQSAEKKVASESDLSHAVAAEARKLSEELREAQKLLDRKDLEIAELQTIVGSNDALTTSVPKGQKNQSMNDFTESFNENPRLWELQAENERLKSIMPTLLNPPPEVERIPAVKSSGFERNGQNNIDAKPKIRLRKELQTLNSALAQVMAASQKAINYLKTENSLLLSRIVVLEKEEFVLKADIAVQKDQLRSTEKELATAKASLQTAVLLKQQNGMQDTGLEWSETKIRLNDALEKISVEKAETFDILTEQQNQISALSTSLQKLQHNIQSQRETDGNPRAALTFKDNFSSEFFDRSPPEVDIKELHMEDIVRLQHLLAEREQEVFYWKAVYSNNSTQDSKYSNVDGINHVSSAPDILRFAPPSRIQSPPAYGNLRTVDHVRRPNSAPPPLDEVMKDDMMKQLINENNRLVQMMEQYQAKVSFVPVTQSPIQATDESKVFRQEIYTNKKSQNTVSAISTGFQDSVHSEYPRYPLKSLPDAARSDLSRPLPKLELPVVDYESLRRRSRAQLIQFENLCRRIDRANERYASYLASSNAENLHSVDG